MLFLGIALSVFPMVLEARRPNIENEIRGRYEYLCDTPSDINEHLPVLRELAKQCGSVVEIGVRSVVSTVAIIQGLSENQSESRTYLGIDLAMPPEDKLKACKKFAARNNIRFDFWKENDMNIEIPEVELLFIDSLHTYCHLTYELEKFSPNVRKYIALHDTSAPWGDTDESCYDGDYSEYPGWFDRSKRGLWPAVEDFLERHPEWRLHERRLNNHGFTILERIEL
jgi:hypothetical protein